MASDREKRLEYLTMRGETSNAARTREWKLLSSLPLKGTKSLVGRTREI